MGAKRAAAGLHRSLSARLEHPPLVAFGAAAVGLRQAAAPKLALPNNIHLVSLESPPPGRANGVVRVRLAHIYEKASLKLKRDYTLEHEPEFKPKPTHRGKTWWVPKRKR